MSIFKIQFIEYKLEYRIEYEFAMKHSNKQFILLHLHRLFE